jgi:Sulfatase
VPRSLPGADDPRRERAFAELYAMQAMQVAAVDQIIGETIAHLKAVGAWDAATLVVTSDHGIDITPPNFTRRIRDDNEDGVLRVPLFVKAPGQTEGETRDEPATTLDIVPSLIDVLGIETDWELDGHSLFDDSAADYERALGDDDFEDGLDYVARQQADLRPGDGWSSVVGIGENGDLVGTPVADHAVGARSGLSWTYDDAEALADPAAAGGRAPVNLRGVVTAPGADPPAGDLVVALDGVISGTIGGYAPAEGEGWSFSGVLGPEVEDGAREVVAYEVERRGSTVTLHPLVP